MDDNSQKRLIEQAGDVKLTPEEKIYHREELAKMMEEPQNKV